MSLLKLLPKLHFTVEAVGVGVKQLRSPSLDLKHREMHTFSAVYAVVEFILCV